MKNKFDFEALNSSFMRIPNMDVATARDLIDLGYHESYELLGRSAESLFEDILCIRPQLPKDCIKKLKAAVYYAENPEADAVTLEAASEGKV